MCTPLRLLSAGSGKGESWLADLALSQQMHLDSSAAMQPLSSAMFTSDPISSPYCGQIATAVEQRAKLEDNMTGQASQPGIVDSAKQVLNGEERREDKDELTSTDFSNAATGVQVSFAGGPAFSRFGPLVNAGLSTLRLT